MYLYPLRDRPYCGQLPSPSPAPKLRANHRSSRHRAPLPRRTSGQRGPQPTHRPAPGCGLDAAAASCPPPRPPPPGSGPRTQEFWGRQLGAFSPRLRGAGGEAARGAEQAPAPPGQRKRAPQPEPSQPAPRRGRFVPKPGPELLRRSHGALPGGGRPDAFPGQPPQRGPGAAPRGGQTRARGGAAFPSARPAGLARWAGRAPRSLAHAPPHLFSRRFPNLGSPGWPRPLPLTLTSSPFPTTSPFPFPHLLGPRSHRATLQTNPRRVLDAPKSHLPSYKFLHSPPHQPRVTALAWKSAGFWAGPLREWAVGASWPHFPICQMGMGMWVRCQALGTRQ